MHFSIVFRRGNSQIHVHTFNCFTTGPVGIFPLSYIFGGLATEFSSMQGKVKKYAHSSSLTNIVHIQRKWECTDRCGRQCGNMKQRSTQGFLFDLMRFFFSLVFTNRACSQASAILAWFGKEKVSQQQESSGLEIA